MNTTTVNITPAQIVEHRDARKNAGMAGCITGRPTPDLDFFGFRDVQIWNVDFHGRMNGDPDFDPKDPLCFCFDCRGAFDPNGIQDAEIVNAGHARARWIYSSLLPAELRPSVNPNTPPDSSSPEPASAAAVETSQLCVGLSNEPAGSQ